MDNRGTTHDRCPNCNFSAYPNELEAHNEADSREGDDFELHQLNEFEINPYPNDWFDVAHNPEHASSDPDDQGESGPSTYHTHPLVPDQDTTEVNDDVTTQINADIDHHIQEYLDRRISRVNRSLREQETDRERLELDLEDTEDEVLELLNRIRHGEPRADRRNPPDVTRGSSAYDHIYGLFARQRELRAEMLWLREQLRDARTAEDRMREELRELRAQRRGLSSPP